ncbi:MFS transporter [Marinoscillum pacificum]|uniref:MFS transporter n=1 Tax=Marinoscillum pacificum TaxID=392723 RepID=UPI0021589BC7|nr:MFS transporter [Marinoscillum pacificum]
MKLFGKLTRETSFFKEQPRDMQVLLMTNMIYAFVLPVIEIFVGAYIMRSSNDPKIVALYQLTVYTGIPFTFMINGYLLRWFRISNLYSFGMLLSGASMFVMMGLETLSFEGVAVAGFLMGASFGFFWANRDYLALGTTNDQNRNYYYGLETFFYTITAILVPLAVGWFLGAANRNGWFGGQMVQSYRMVTVAVVVLTILSSIVIHRDRFKNPAQKKFLFFKFDQLWNKLMALAGLKGMVQGYLVTAPAILIMRLVGDEGSLGLIQGVSGAFTAVMLYLIGRMTKPKHRITILSVGLVIFTVGTLVNGILFSSIGVMVFVLCKVLFQPLHDIAYFPIQMRVIDVVSAKEKRNEFAYIFNHEFGLYLGRFFGLGLFIALATYVSETFALKYSLIVVAVLQLLSIPLAKHITKQTDAYEGKSSETEEEPLIAVAAANETTI